MDLVSTDDIGSFPVPGGVEKDALRIEASKVVDGSASSEESQEFGDVVSRIFMEKVSSGVGFPNYPQVQEMIDAFYNPMEAYGELDEPFVVVEEKAVIAEVKALKDHYKKFFDESGEPVKLRVCVTGPLDLYARKISTQVEGDLLLNFGKSIGRFVKNALIDEPHIKTSLISIDEPSLGLNPNLIFEREDLVKAWDKATEHVKGLDVQLHLHAPNEAEIAFESEKINVIGVETAENPQHLNAISKKDLESCDRFLRVGIARSNITALSSDYEAGKGVNPLNNPESAVEMVELLETPQVIKKRLEDAYSIFGDRIRYVGPDCGLGLWPTADSARKLLENTVRAVAEFKKA